MKNFPVTYNYQMWGSLLREWTSRRCNSMAGLYTHFRSEGNI